LECSHIAKNILFVASDVGQQDQHRLPGIASVF
jgi:hypothetical protein